MNADSSHRVPSGPSPLVGQPDALGLCPWERGARRQSWQVAGAVFSRLVAYLFESRLLTRVNCLPAPHPHPHPPAPSPFAPGTSYSGKLSLTNSPQGQSVSLLLF